MTETPATRAAAESGLDHEVVEYGPVASVEEAAEARGVDLRQVIKTIVVRRGEGDHVMVLVPGDRVIDWGKLRALLGVSRLSLAAADEAIEATGYAPGTITPFGSSTALPVIADALVTGLVSIGGGAHGVAIHIDAADLIAHFDAEVAEVTRGSEERVASSE
ncbi:MAG TPA: YbaK/EbsC family protein [Acidimicrobiia bacterium]|nr:YbaK/EbsC family protein [Acidimicrobiia bacterium]